MIQKPLTLAQLAGYLSTWSGVQHYMEKQKQDPVAMILPELQKAWGKAEKLQVTWPVKLRAGIIAAAP